MRRAITSGWLVGVVRSYLQGELANLPRYHVLHSYKNWDERRITFSINEDARYDHTHISLLPLLSLRWTRPSDFLARAIEFRQLKSISIFHPKYSRAGKFERIDLQPVTFDRNISEGEEIESGADQFAEPNDVF